MSSLGLLNTRQIPEVIRVRDTYESRMLRRFPAGMASLTAILELTKPKVMTDVSTTWGFLNYELPHCVLGAIMTAGTPAGLSKITVTNAKFLYVGAILIGATTGEQLRVVNVAGNTITVKRSMFPKAAAAGSVFQVIGNAYEEGSIRPMSSSGYSAFNGLSKGYNHVQIVRTPWSVTGTANAISLNNREDIRNVTKHERENKAWVHMNNLEAMYLDGQFVPEYYENNQPIRHQGGFFDQMNRYAPQNVMHAPSIIDMDTLEDMLSVVTKVRTDPAYPADPILLASSDTITKINRLGKMTYNIQYPPSLSKLGQEFTSIQIGSKTFKFVASPYMDVSPLHQGTIAVIDASSMRRGVLRATMETKANSDDALGIDALSGDFLTESCLIVESPTANAVIKGICDIGCKVCVPVSITKGSLTVSHPCTAGSVESGTVVTVTVTGPATASINVQTPTGIQAVTLNAAGTGSFTYTTTATESHAFSIVPDPALQVVFFPANAQVCVRQGCEPVKLPATTTCPPTIS